MKLNNKIHIWDKMAKSFHEMSSRSVVLKDRYSKIAKIIVKVNPSSILDLGCGSGLLEKELLKNNFTGKICAIDASSEMLKLAKAACGHSVDFIKQDLNDSINLQARFDIVVAINVMFFLDDKERFLNEVKNLLKNENSLFILINPKSNDESSIIQFIKDHFKSTTFIEKFFIVLNEITNLPKYYRMITGQAQLWRMSKKGEIIFHKKDDILEISKKVGLIVDLAEDYRTSQSWLFIMRRGK